MLSADFGHLERDTRMVDASAAEWVHIDVMDGVFVPNINVLPNKGIELFFGIYLFWIFHQELQDFKFLCGQVNLFSCFQSRIVLEV